MNIRQVSGETSSLAPSGALESRTATSPDLSSGLMAGAERRLAPFVAAILASGYDNGPAAGPGSQGFHRPRGFSFLDRRDGLAGQGACGSASMHCHAAVIASAHGQVAWIFRRRFRPPRTSRPAECSTRRLGLGFGQVAVQGQELEPGEQDLPGHRRGQPRSVDPEVKGRSLN